MHIGRKIKTYELDDGSVVSVKDIATKVGCRLNTAYLRLQKSNKVAKVYLPLQNQQQRDMKQGAEKEKWVDAPVKVVMGIPINPSYMDGSPAGSVSKDRNGIKMTVSEARRLMHYRATERDAWLQSKGVLTPDEEDLMLG